MRAWRLCVAFLSGVLLGGHGAIITVGWIAVGVVLAWSRPWLAVLIAAVVLGAWRGQPAPPGLLEQLVGSPPCTYEVTVAERAGALGTMLDVHSVACHGRPMIVSERAVVDPLDHEPGTRLLIGAAASRLGSDGFSLARRRIGARVELHPLETVVLAPPGSLLGAAAAFRSSMRQATSSVGGDNAALLRGLAIGDTDGLDPVTQDRFRASGLSHLVAVSGSNVAMVVAAALLIVRPLGTIAGHLAATVVLGLYVLVVGPEPSVLRAAAMGVIAIGAILSGRRARSMSALACAVICVVAFKPYLIHSAGLHLSVAATAGIILWSESLTARIPGPRWIVVPLGVTLSAQMAVAPVLAATFQEVPLVAPLSNALAGPAVAPATVIALGAGAIGLASAGLGRFAMIVASPFSRWILSVAGWFGDVPVWHTSGPVTVLLTVAVAMGIVITVGGRSLR